MSIKDISQLKDRVNNYIPLHIGLFISNEAASSQRESIRSLSNNINRDYSFVKLSVRNGQRLGTQVVEISCVRVVGLCTNNFIPFKIFFGIVIILLYNK